MIKLKPFKSTYLFLFILMNFQLISCAQNVKTSLNKVEKKEISLKTGAERTNLYLNYLRGKNVALVANQTSVIKRKEIKEFNHLVDSLLTLKINIKKVFSPEHGFRGKADAGAYVEDGVDEKTGLPILSLHGKNKKPTKKQLKDVDIVVFDIQDVGVRFYTYISTLHYVMEACAEVGIPLIVLDRPNPNAHYVDGPVLELEHKSFVGMHPVPVVYGMTIGEYGQMINGEKWLKDGINSNLIVIPIKNYTYDYQYNLPIKPSPNLPNQKSINLYPSLGFLEGTTINAGRGTDSQFQIYGAPFFKKTNFYFTPYPNNGAKYPKHKGKLCYGKDLRDTEYLSKIDLTFLMETYRQTPKNELFFGKTFTIHAGTKKLQQQIEQGLTEQEIRTSWKKGLDKFKKIREKYLLYK